MSRSSKRREYLPLGWKILTFLFWPFQNGARRSNPTMESGIPNRFQIKFKCFSSESEYCFRQKVSIAFRRAKQTIKAAPHRHELSRNERKSRDNHFFCCPKCLEKRSLEIKTPTIATSTILRFLSLPRLHEA